MDVQVAGGNAKADDDFIHLLAHGKIRFDIELAKGGCFRGHPGFLESLVHLFGDLG